MDMGSAVSAALLALLLEEPHDAQGTKAFVVAQAKKAAKKKILAEAKCMTATVSFF
jgi:hypothetical protein